MSDAEKQVHDLEAFEGGQRLVYTIADGIRVLIRLALAALAVFVAAWLCVHVSETLGGIVWLVGGLWWIINAAGSGIRWRMRNFPRPNDVRNFSPH